MSESRQAEKHLPWNCKKYEKSFFTCILQVKKEKSEVPGSKDPNPKKINTAVQGGEPLCAAGSFLFTGLKERNG